MKASAIKEAITIIRHEILGVNEKAIITRCDDYVMYKTLPSAVSFENEIYGKTGWNSDTRIAYFKTNQPVAMAIGE